MNPAAQPVRSGTERSLRNAGIADELARRLRRRILDGPLRDGDMLPKQDDLIAEFGVGRTTLRQAFRILETEGLITVKRGNTGGAVVHVPQPADAAHMFGMVMHARQVRLDDLAQALRRLEPVCAALCAARPDRATEVVPWLREVHARMERAVEDGPAYIRAGRDFHEALVLLCGNETMKILLGAVEVLWAQQEREWAQEALADTGERVRRAGLRDHERLIALIEAGDESEVYRESVRHLEAAQDYPLRGRGGAPITSP
ncbi:FadR/GntR family transcriptional regulator [Embleya sp. NPDC050154]|uniref:FadR/GntR family transcriptional regulator n=1 Tax=unclassified Embleya TaxID=2699296 RepID=UPI0037B7740F